MSPGGAAVLVGVFALVFPGPGTGPTLTTESESTSTPFARIPLETWGSDLRVSNALDDCWQRLESLEKTR